MREVFICDAIRTPVGRFAGSLSSVRTDDLASRQLMEQEITAEINAAGVKATSSYIKYP